MTRNEHACIWLAHVEKQQRSGMSQNAYCITHDLSLKSFAYWRRKQRRPALLVPRLLPVHVVDEPPLTPAAGSGVRVQTGCVVIDLAWQFDAPTLQRVLSVLERRPC